jgi:hypothetical protein
MLYLADFGHAWGYKRIANSAGHECCWNKLSALTPAPVGIGLEDDHATQSVDARSSEQTDKEMQGNQAVSGKELVSVQEIANLGRRWSTTSGNRLWRKASAASPHRMA